MGWLFNFSELYFYLFFFLRLKYKCDLLPNLTGGSMEMTWAMGTQGALAFSLVLGCLGRFSIISLPAEFTSWLHKGSRARFPACLSLCGSRGEKASERTDPGKHKGGGTVRFGGGSISVRFAAASQRVPENTRFPAVARELRVVASQTHLGMRAHEKLLAASG